MIYIYLCEVCIYRLKSIIDSCLYLNQELKYVCKNLSTSALTGNDGIAPDLVMQRKAALLPNCMAFW